MSDFVGVGIVAVALGSAAIGTARRVLERRRARRELVVRPDLEPATSEGTVVRVTGVVRVLERTLEAPLSGATCVVARSRVRAGGGIARRAVRPRESFAMVPFLLERPEGTVSIEGAHALLDLEPIALGHHLGKASAARARREHFLLLHGFKMRESVRALFEETIVGPGMTVTIAGLMMKDPLVEPSGEVELGFRDAAAPSLRLAGNADHPLVIGLPVDRARLA